MERSPALSERLVALGPDCLVLTEYRASNAVGSFIRDQLQRAGYVHQFYSSASRGVLVAARTQFHAIENPANFDVDGGGIVRGEFSKFVLYGLYLPQKEKKFPHFDYLISEARAFTDRRVICIGDFNTGRNVLDIEQNRANTVLRNDFSAADHFRRLEEHWTDAWRYLRPDGSEYSWYSKGYKTGLVSGWRIDHCFVSAAILPALRDAQYLHDVRLAGLTDHSALVVDIDLSKL